MNQSMPVDARNVAMREFHGTYPWKKARRLAKLKAGFTCQRCGRFLPEPGGLHVHHRKPVESAPALGLEPLTFMVLCPACHNAIEPRIGERLHQGCDIDGNPTDARHPWNIPKP